MGCDYCEWHPDTCDVDGCYEDSEVYDGSCERHNREREQHLVESGALQTMLGHHMDPHTRQRWTESAEAYSLNRALQYGIMGRAYVEARMHG